MPSSELYVGYGSGPWSRGSWGQDVLAISVDGTEATGEVGVINVQAQASVVLTGVEGSGFIGVEDVDPVTNVSVTGLEAEGQTGTLQTSFSYTVNSIVATGFVGGYVVDPNQDNDGGWGSNEYGLGTWGGGVTYVYVTGLAATGILGIPNPGQSVSVVGVEGEGQVGNGVVVAKATVELNNFNTVGSALLDPVGISATGNVTPAGFQHDVLLGQETIITKANIFPIGVEGEGTLGQVLQKTINNVPTIGQEGTGEVGTVDVDAKANIYVFGTEGTGELGETDEDAKGNVFLTGVQGVGQLGQEEAEGGVYVQVTGVVGTTQLGETDESGKANIYVIGVSGTGRVARPLVWGLIDTAQTPNWLPLAA